MTIGLSVSPVFSQVTNNTRVDTSAADAARAAPKSNAGEIPPAYMEAYQKQMRAAMAITDPPRRDAAVTAARQQLARNINKPLTAATVAEIDGLLDIGGISPQLGTTG